MAAGEGPEGHYYVFDLDETLGQMHSFFYYMCTLRPDEHFSNTNPARKSAAVANVRFGKMQERLGVAYRGFVRAIAEKESSAEPLGLLRPGILEVFRAIQAQKESGKPVCCMIYSNNGSLFLLELTRDVIHAALGVDNLIQDCVHWYHPTRRPEIQVGSPGVANKTWSVLSKLLKEGGCGAPEDLHPEQVTFFDDRIHPDLKATLKDNSIKVIPYSYKTPCVKVNKLYNQALTEAGLLDTAESKIDLLLYIRKHCGTVKYTDGFITWTTHLASLIQFTGKTSPDDSVPPPRLADTDALIAAVTKNDIAVENASETLGNNPLSAINSNVFRKTINTFSGGRGSILRRRVLTKRNRSGAARKKTRHIRRRR